MPSLLPALRLEALAIQAGLPGLQPSGTSISQVPALQGNQTPASQFQILYKYRPVGVLILHPSYFQ